MEIAWLHRPSSHKRSLKSECGPILCFLKSTTAAIAIFRQRIQQSGHRRRPLAVHGLPRAGVILSEATEVESTKARNLPEDLLNFSCVFFYFIRNQKFSLALGFISYGFIPSDEPSGRNGFFSKEQEGLTGWKRMTKQKRGSKSGFICNLDVSFSMLNVAKKKKKKSHRRRQEYLSDGTL